MQGFCQALDIRLLGFNEDIVDVLKNGQIQKFEIVTELEWKASKLYVEKEFGDVLSSPKSVFKKMFLEDKIDEKFLQNLFQTIDDRNQLSYIYKTEMFDYIYPNLQQHANTFLQYALILEQQQ